MQKILYNAYAHNDEWHKRPLFDSLDAGFNAVEADVHLIDGGFFVGHEEHELVRSARGTLEKMYLDPLINRIKTNSGVVHPGSVRLFMLMIDCKTNGDELYAALEKKLIPCRDFLCSAQNDVYHERALIIILCGHLPEKTFRVNRDRYVFMTGRAEHLGKNVPFAERPLINVDFQKYSAWNGEGEMALDELAILRNLIGRTHDEGKWFRIYFAPDTETAHYLFYREGVDFISTDNMVTLCSVLGNSPGEY
jgi:hypothetical protein